MRLFFVIAVWLMLVARPGLSQDGLKKISQHEAMEATTHKVPPDYPAVAKQLHIQGTAEVEAVIGESGGVEHVKTVSGSPVLTKAASEALMKWKFKPFTEDGKAVKVVVTLSFTFNM